MTPEPADDPVEQILATLTARPPLASGVRILCIDGRSGTGKTSLAAKVAAAGAGAVLHMDDLYDGWHGLDAGIDLARTTVAPLASEGRRLSVPHYDWVLSAYMAPRDLEVPDLVIIEGVGAASSVLREFATAVVWLEAGAAERQRRALARGGEDFDGHWHEWESQESTYIAREHPREAADLIYATSDSDAAGSDASGSISP